MNKPQTIEEAQQLIENLQTQLAEAKNKNKKVKEPELLIEYETGYLQIRRLIGKSVNLPTFVIRWILENAQKILSFITTHQAMLAGQNDTEAMTQSRLQLRTENLTADNPVVRKPRAKSETQKF